jgi:hypothetical protein
MTSQNTIAKLSVQRLLAQYAEYLELDKAVSLAKAKYEQRLLAVAKERAVPLSDVATLVSQDLEVQYQASVRDYYLRLRERMADEMTFTSPQVWMLYKAKAYTGTPQAITTWGAFRSHCTPTGYICTKRDAFVREAARVYAGINIDTLESKLPLVEVCEMPWVLAVMDKSEVMNTWLQHEFYMREQRVAKWEDVS